MPRYGKDTPWIWQGHRFYAKMWSIWYDMARYVTYFEVSGNHRNKVLYGLGLRSQQIEVPLFWNQASANSGHRKRAFHVTDPPYFLCTPLISKLCIQPRDKSSKDDWTHNEDRESRCWKLVYFVVTSTMYKLKLLIHNETRLKTQKIKEERS